MQTSRGAVDRKHARDVEHETRREDVDQWLQLEAAEVGRPLESTNLVEGARKRTVQPDDSVQPEGDGKSTDAEFTDAVNRQGSEEAGVSRAGCRPVPLERGDNIEEEPDHNLLTEILSEIRGNHQEQTGAASEVDSVTVSEMTSEAGIDPDLAVSFKAAKMVRLVRLSLLELLPCFGCCCGLCMKELRGRRRPE